MNKVGFGGLGGWGGGGGGGGGEWTLLPNSSSFVKCYRSNWILSSNSRDWLNKIGSLISDIDEGFVNQEVVDVTASS